MKLSSGCLVVLMLALAAWVPGACALDYSFGVQNEGNAFAHAVHAGSDSIEESVTSTSSNGDTATAYYGVTGGLPLYALVGKLSPDFYYPYAYAWVDLSVASASHIIAGAKSSSHNGQKAEVSTEVFDGSLLNYKAAAYADSDIANATQSFSLVQGTDITIKNSASNTEKDRVNVSTEALNGIISDYSSSASAYSDRVGAYQNIAGFAIGSELLLRSNASNSANANGWAKTGLYVENGAILSASGNATSDKKNAYADNWVANAAGGKIEAGWFAGQGNPIGSDFAAMGGVGVNNGAYSGHSAAEYIYSHLSRNQASGLQVIDEASGDEILFGAEGTNRSEGALTMQTNVTGYLVKGSVGSSYVTNATASAWNVTSGISSTSDSLLWGDNVSLNISAWNVNGQMAKGNTTAIGSAIVKNYNSSARAEIYSAIAQGARVYENATDVSGDYVFSTWNASNSYGENLSGQIVAYEQKAGYVNLSLNKLSNVAPRSMTAKQIINATGDSTHVLNVSVIWNAGNARGAKVAGSANLTTLGGANNGPNGGYLWFDSSQTVLPTEVDASTSWKARAQYDYFKHGDPFDDIADFDHINMSWTAKDPYGDIAVAEAYGGNAAIIVKRISFYNFYYLI